MSRITLITYFDSKELAKISKLLNDIDDDLCKMPYGINDEKRHQLDNLPYHFTVFATNKNNQEKLQTIANNLEFNNIKLKVDKIDIMNGQNNSYVLYLGIEDNEDIKDLQRLFYNNIPGENYNPDKFTFHLTLHIDKDKDYIYNLKEKINKTFKPFTIEFSKLLLFDYPGDMIQSFQLGGKNEER